MTEPIRPEGSQPAEPMPEGEEAAPPGVRTMALVRWGLVALMGVAAGAGSRGTSFMPPHFSQRASGSSEVTSGCMGHQYLPFAAVSPAGAAGAAGAAAALRAPGSTFTRSMPQMGHSPGRSWITEGCMGHW